MSDGTVTIRIHGYPAGPMDWTTSIDLWSAAPVQPVTIVLDDAPDHRRRLTADLAGFEPPSHAAAIADLDFEWVRDWVGLLISPTPTA